MQQIRKNYLSDSTVTIYLIGKYSAEKFGKEKQLYIKRELQASLYNGEGNTRSGLLGVVLPEMYDAVYNSITTLYCTDHSNVVSPYYQINDMTVIREFGQNYYMKNIKKCICEQSSAEQYCVLARWSDLISEKTYKSEWAI